MNFRYYYSIIIIALFFKNIECKCLFQEFYGELECTGIDMEELSTYFMELERRNDNGLSSLQIENSNLPQLKMLPKNRKFRTITIRNSGLKSIEPECFRELHLEVLDLSYNELTATNFSKYINSNMRKLNLSHNNIGHLNLTEFPSLYEFEILDLSYNKIPTFEKLPYFRRLHNLDLSNNRLAKLDNLLITIGSLDVIDLSNNQLVNLTAKNFPDQFPIEDLNLRGNQLIYFDPHIRVRRLDLSQNPLSKFEILSSDLRFLNVSNSNIQIDWISESYSELSIDFSNKNLTDLDFMPKRKFQENNINTFNFSNNQLSSLPSNTLNNFYIHILDLSQNNIVNISSNAFGDVEMINLSSNQLKRIDLLIFTNIFKLSTLDLSYNPLEILENSIEVKNNLVILDLSHCLLNRLDAEIFKNFQKLNSLNLSHNKLKEIPANIFQNIPLNNLDISHNYLKSLPDNLLLNLNLNTLNLSHNYFLNFPGKAFNNSNILNLVLDGLIFPEIKNTDFEGLKGLNFLNLSNNGIKKLNSDAFNNLEFLEKLYLDNNNIETIPENFLTRQERLEILSLRGNNISKIHPEAFSYYSYLDKFTITFNADIVAKTFLQLFRLKELNIIDSNINKIHNGSFRGLVNLNKITFNNSNVTTIEPGAFIGLKNVVDFDSKNLFKLIKTIKTNQFHGLEKLRTLDLSDIGLETIENDAFMGLENLEILDLSHNNLTGKQSTFPLGIFRDLINLNELHLQYNEIIKFHIGEFSNLRNLQFLNLSHNQLSYLDRHLMFPLKSLEILDINSNHVIEFDYEFIQNHLLSLKTIGIGSNKWKCENLTTMLNSFQQHQVNYLKISDLEYKTENIDGIYCVDICNYVYCPKEDDY